MFEIRVARENEFDKIKNFYSDLIVDSANGRFGPKWQENVYPSPEMLRNAIDNAELFIGEDGGRLTACMILKCNYNDQNVAMIHALGANSRFFIDTIESQMAKFAINYAIRNKQKSLLMDGRNYYLYAARTYKDIGFKSRADEDVYEYQLPPEIMIQEMDYDEMEDVQRLVDKSFEVNHPYFPQVFSYDNKESIEELSLNYYHHKGKKIYKMIAEGVTIGCAVITIHKDNTAYVDLLCIDAKHQKQNFGYAAWIAIERHFNQVNVWTLETPICLIKNVCFYVNKCGFSIIMLKDYNHDFRRFVFRKNIV